MPPASWVQYGYMMIHANPSKNISGIPWGLAGSHKLHKLLKPNSGPQTCESTRLNMFSWEGQIRPTYCTSLLGSTPVPRDPLCGLWVAPRQCTQQSGALLSRRDVEERRQRSGAQGAGMT